MREALQERANTRGTFCAVVDRVSLKSVVGLKRKTILLKSVTDDQGHVLTDHSWMDYCKQFEQLDLRKGDVLRFNARVKDYIKGYQGDNESIEKRRELDYKLTRPTRVVKVGTREEPEGPETQAERLLRLREEKEAILSQYHEKGEVDGREWAKRASFADLHRATALRPKFDRWYGRCQVREDNAVSRHLRMALRSDFLMMNRGDSEYVNGPAQSFIKGFVEAVQKFWNEIEAVIYSSTSEVTEELKTISS